jgi:hypothetical protein
MTSIRSTDFYLRSSCGLFFFVLTTIAAVADLGKDTAYFYDRNGAPVRSDSPQSISYFHPLENLRKGTVKGPFSRRTYQTGKLRTVVVFGLPSLKAVVVEYHLPHKWTAEQIRDALSVYSDTWTEKIATPNDAIKSSVLQSRAYVSQTGLVAKLALGRTLYVFSPEILSAMAEDIIKQDEHRREVPEF